MEEKETSRNMLQVGVYFFWFLPWISFNPEDRGDVFLRNVGLSPYYRT
jgi:hypothetical protein